MKKKSLFIFTVFIFTILLMPCEIVLAATNILPIASNNTNRALRRFSSIVSVDSGYMRVFYNKDNNNIGIEYYDNNFKITKTSKISMELDMYGGFYAGKDAYYIVEGQTNTTDTDGKEAIRVIKYDKNWKKLGHASIKSNEGNDEFRIPFSSGCVEMTEVNGKLYIVTGRTGYYDEDVRQGHQGMVLIEVNESTLESNVDYGNYWHSFAQYIDYKDGNLYVYEQNEGSGNTSLTRYILNNSNEFNDYTSYNGRNNRKLISVLDYGGDRSSVWAQKCYASVDGIALTQNNILGIGTSIDQSRYDEAVSAKLPHNIYLTITPMNDFTKESTTVKWLTNYTDANHAFTGLEIIKINDNRFLVTWSEYQEEANIIDTDTLSTGVLHYVFIDGNGNKTSKEYTAQASFSDCKPIVKGSKVVYYASNGNMVDFYTIDTTTGNFNKVIYRVAGEKATWSLSKDGVLSISGTGAITVNPDPGSIYPLSSTYQIYSSSNNTWNPIKSSVKQIDIKEGITSIPDNEFKYFSALTKVVLPNTMKTIGASAFESCYYLKEIYMPSNISSIGNDALWSGYLSASTREKLIYAKIYTPKNSYAESWAIKNGARYETIADTFTGLRYNDSKKRWEYYKNGKADYSYNGLATNENGIWKVTNGIIDFKAKGMYKINNTWYYIKDSKVIIDYNGIATNENGTWKFTNGTIDFKTTGMYKTDRWYYVKDSKVIIDYNGIATNENGTWKFTNGTIDFKTNMVYKVNNTDYYISGSKVVYNGMYKINNTWRYISNGKVVPSYNGLATNENGTWKYTNGTIDMKTTGMYKINNRWYYVRKSSVIKDYNGLATNENGTWKFTNGTITFKYNGTYKDSTGKIYTIRNSKVV